MPRSPTPASAPPFLAEAVPLPVAEGAAANLPGLQEEEAESDGGAGKPARSDPGKVPKWLKLPGTLPSGGGRGSQPPRCRQGL